MSWLDKWFDEEDWPQDPGLDIFRDSVWELFLENEAVGWLTSSVSPMRSFPLFWIKDERLWTQVHWLNGERGLLEEDYGPDWPAAEELRNGLFTVWHPPSAREATFEARVVPDSERDLLWARLQHGVE